MSPAEQQPEFNLIMAELIPFLNHLLYTFFFYKQLVYKQPQAQIAKNLSTLLSTLSASDLVSKVTLLRKLLLVTKNTGENVKTMQIC